MKCWRMFGAPTGRVAWQEGKAQLTFEQGRLDQHAGVNESWGCRMYFETNSGGFVERMSSSGCCTRSYEPCPVVNPTYFTIRLTTPTVVHR